MIVRKQEILIDGKKRYIENKEDFKNSLGDNKYVPIQKVNYIHTV